MTAGTPYVFISYFRNDRNRIEPALKALRQRGIAFWIDESGLEVGEAWERSITERIQNASAFLVFLSKEYERRPSSYVRRELEIANAWITTQGESVRWLLPVLLDSVNMDTILPGSTRALGSYHVITAARFSRWSQRLANDTHALVHDPSINQGFITLTNLDIKAAPFFLVVWSGDAATNSSSALPAYPMEQGGDDTDARIVGNDGELIEPKSFIREVFEFNAKRLRSAALPGAPNLGAGNSRRYAFPPGAYAFRACSAEYYGESARGSTPSHSYFVQSQTVALDLAARRTEALVARRARGKGFLWLSTDADGLPYGLTHVQTR